MRFHARQDSGDDGTAGFDPPGRRGGRLEQLVDAVEPIHRGNRVTLETCGPLRVRLGRYHFGAVALDIGNHGHRYGQLPVFAADLSRPPQTVHVLRSHLTEGVRLAKGWVGRTGRAALMTITDDLCRRQAHRAV